MMNARKFIGVNWKSSSTGNEIQVFLPGRDLKVTCMISRFKCKLQSEEEESFTKWWNQQNKKVGHSHLRCYFVVQLVWIANFVGEPSSS